MSNLPDFSDHGYQIVEQLGQNREGGRITYKATRISDRRTVTIKQFRFANQSDWTGYKSIEREIEVLTTLNHIGIPRYLGSFDSGDGICLVQEYKKALPLSAKRYFNLTEIWEIAAQILGILVYLQDRDLPIIHRDIKPENILVKRTSRLEVYLVDFGYARAGEGRAAPSSVISGTMGFMPPEQLLNQPLTNTSDLYSLGITIICLLTRTESVDVSKFFDLKTFKLQLEQSLPKLDRRIIKWLRQMTASDPSHRFPDARSALDALKSQAKIWMLPKKNLRRNRIAMGAAAFTATSLAGIAGAMLFVDRRSNIIQELRSNPEIKVGETQASAPTPAVVPTPAPAPEPKLQSTPVPTPASTSLPPNPTPAPAPPPQAQTQPAPSVPKPLPHRCLSALRTLESNQEFQQSRTAVYFCSTPGDYIGRGEEKVWTPVDGNFTATTRNQGNSVDIRFNGGPDYISISFAAPQQSPLRVGTYRGAYRYPFQSPTKPGLSISMSGRGCNESYGDFAVHQIQYDAEKKKVILLDLSFDQRCGQEKKPPLVGRIRYNSADSPSSKT